MNKYFRFDRVVVLLLLANFAGIFTHSSGAADVGKLVVDDNSTFLLKNGHVFSWGRNEFGQLGYLREDGKESGYQPQAVRGLSGVTDIQMLHGVSCALARGVLYCWGKGYSPTPQKIKTQIKSGPITAFGLSYWGICLAGSKKVTCLRWKTHYDFAQKSVPENEFEIEFSEPIRQMKLAGTSLCVLAGDQIYCGDQIYKIENLNQFKEPIFLGQKFGELIYKQGELSFPLYYHPDNIFSRFCGRDQSGSVYCATHYAAALEDGTDRVLRDVNEKPRGGIFKEDVLFSGVELVISKTLACTVNVIAKDLWCWVRGNQGFGVKGLTEVISAAVGGKHVCAGTLKGVFCFGFNEFGQLGTFVKVGLQDGVKNPQKIEELPKVIDYEFNAQNLSQTFSEVSKIAVGDKAKVFETIIKSLPNKLASEVSITSYSLRKTKFENESAEMFASLVISPLIADYAPDSIDDLNTELEKFYGSYQSYLEKEVGIQNGIPDLSLIPYSKPVEAVAREVLDASLRALSGVSGEANVEAYQNLLAEVSKTQDLRSVVQLVDAQREWIENTAASNQSKRCFAQMVLNITEYLRGNL